MTASFNECMSTYQVLRNTTSLFSRRTYALFCGRMRAIQFIQMDALTPVFWQLLEDTRDLFTSVSAFKNSIWLFNLRGAHCSTRWNPHSSELGYSTVGDLNPIVYQDNKSTTHLARRGPGVVARSKHFSVRYFYLSKQLLDDKVIIMDHISSEDMQADFMTKPNQGRLFYARVYFMLGYD